MTFRLYVFDLDGTLIDSRRDLADAVNALLVAHRAPPLPEEEIGRMVGDGAAVLVARAFDAARVPKPHDALDRFRALYAERLTEHTRPYDGIPEVLATLSASATLAIVTNKPLDATRTILDRLALAQFFADDLVFGGDGPYPRKPDPSTVRHVMQRQGAGPNATLLVGDSAIDWRTARDAPTMMCVARYGFGFAGFPLEEMTGRELLIDAPGELLGL